ncbi:ubiquitin carboxyl-terminal hydrolase 32-like isoform X3 [Apostichopus japonicus]|uniref:ubiquitin carboxyl-terminal hydrolase 32-like isoform X3 n=1 Tax=Stichopus japonicus TaxID=307972 RepID=UPI003AB57F8A
MGNKESKSLIISYDEAIKRVSEDEHKRIQEAFKRYSTPAGYMSKAIFARDVFGEGMPQKLAEHLFYAFGGSSKGIGFKELFCGLVLLTKGTQAEKLRFIFSIIAHHEDGYYVARVDLETFISACDGTPIPSDLVQLFRNDPRVSYEQFCSWLLRNIHVMKLSAWLLEEGSRKGLRLSDESDTPTFYQTLAGVTHLEEADIIELEKRYWALQSQSKSGRVDLDTLRPLISPPLPVDLVQGLFNAFDENKDSHIDLKEMACGLSACCRGPKAERLKFCFKIFDLDRDGLLSRNEVEEMCKSLLSVRRESRVNQEIDLEDVESLDPVAIAGDILASHDEDKDGFITAEEFQVWAVKNSLPDEFSKLLFQICHIVLGLRPATTSEEKEIILGWVDREKRRGMKATQTWYLIAADWWQTWLKYVSYKPNVATANKGTQAPAADNQVQQSAVTPNSHSSSPSHAAWQERSSPHSATSSLPASFRKKVDGSIHPMPTPDGGHSSSPKKKTGRASAKEDVNSGPAKPGPINNTTLIIPDVKKQVTSLTNEGGRLRKQPPLLISRDYETLPDPVWKALNLWYAGGPALPRNVIIPDPQKAIPVLELHPIHVKLLQHEKKQNKNGGWNGVSFGGLSLGSGQLGNLLNSSSSTTTPKKYLTHTACFSKLHTVQQVHEFLAQRIRIPNEEMRLWNFRDESNPALIEEDSATMEKVGIVEEQSILIEIRNKDLSWPEEMSLLAKNKQDKYKQVISEGGVTGLSNLGNTCFMNAAVQCISNTQPLTLYFKTDSYLHELNMSNLDGMKGHIARRYGELVNDLWSGTAKSIAPLKLRWTIAKYSRTFNDSQQHDSQELLSFLLDGLHEDLNRVRQKKYVELKDSDGRPDEEVAKEAWDSHLVRNQSVVVDLFQGLLKSQVRCKHCGNTSVRFDPFTFLSLPLPMESSMHIEIIVVRIDGSVPLKYGLRLNLDDKYRTLKRELAELCNLSAEQLLLVEIAGAMVKSFPQDNQKVRSFVGAYAYEIPLVQDDTKKADEEVKNTESPQGTSSTTTSSTSASNMPLVNDVSKEVASASPPDHSPGVTVGITITDTTGYQPGDSSASSSAKTSAATTPSPDATSTNSEKPFGSNVLQKPNHVRSPSNVSVASSVASGHTAVNSGSIEGLVVAMHRKQIRMDMYFLAWQKARPCLFSTPLILPASSNTLKSDLYKSTWTHVSRLVVSTGSQENGHIHNKNHAEDGSQSKGPASADSSPQQKYPFTLKVVQKDGLNCALCPWYRFCRGCDIPCIDEPLGTGVAFIAIEWDPTALHLRYQASQERAFVEHESVEKSRRMQTEPIDLDDCLRAFTKEEELGEDEKYYCSKCKEHRLAAKKLDIWRLPPILIIHLKRFQYVNGRWVKSRKIVKCPEEKFSLSNFIAPRAKERTSEAPLENGELEELATARSDTNQVLSVNSIDVNSVQKDKNDEEAIGAEGVNKSTGSLQSSDIDPREKYILRDGEDGEAEDLRGSEKDSNSCESDGARDGLVNGGLETEDSSDGESVSKRRLRSVPSLSEPVDASASHPLISKDEEEADGKSGDQYKMYAVVCHTGILGGGHYVSYAVNPNKRWYSYNDSSVKEVKNNIDLDHAYMLFYERDDLDYTRFIPNHKGAAPELPPIDDEIEDNFRKLCVIQ